MRLRARLAFTLLVATLFSLAAAAQDGRRVEAEDGRPPSSWSQNDRLRPVHRLLRAGKWKRAAERAGELVDAAIATPPQPYAFADALLMRAVADANLGRLRQAEVGLWAAESLGRRAFPSLRDYGSGGRFLWDERLRCTAPRWLEEVEAEPCTAADPLADAAVTPPRPLAAGPLDPGSFDLPAGQGDEHVLVRLLVDETGRPTEASMLAAGDQRLAPAALAAVAEWRFEPARRAGEPVAAIYETSLPLAPVVRPTERPDDGGGVDGWRRRLAAADAALAAGDHAAALAAAAALQEEMERHLAAGGSDLLAEALTARALAEAGLAAEGGEGMAAAAAWHWQAAQNLAPQVRYRNLAGYGAAGRALAAHTLAPATGVVEADDEAGPAVVERVDPPAAAASGGVVEIGVAVDGEGRPSRPVWNAGVSPARLSAALEALRGWRFEAASGEVRRRVVVQVAEQEATWPVSPDVLRLAHLVGASIEGDPVLAECLWTSAQSLEPRLSAVAPAILADSPAAQRFVRRHLLAPRTAWSWSPYRAPAVSHVGGEIEPPVKLTAPQPSFTDRARQHKVQGVVIVQSVIDDDGRLRRMRVLKGLPDGLSESTVATICTWRFRPARLDGEPVDVYYNLTVNFTLK